MLSEIELKKYYIEHELSQSAIDYIEETRHSDPSRLVGTQARGNVCTNFVSHKMGFTIQTESRTAENAFAIEFEFSSSIMAYWDQPPVVMVRRVYKNGEVRAGYYHPDFIVLGDDGPLVVEVKTEEDLQKLIKNKPKDWLYENGEYIYRPAKEKFADIGLKHVVYSTAQLSHIRTENLRILLYARESESKVTDILRRKIKNAFKECVCIKLYVLSDIIHCQDITPIIQLIADGELFFKVNDELLSEPESTWLSPIVEMLDFGCEGESEEANEQNDDVPTSKVPGLKEAEDALERLKRVEKNENCSSVRKFKQRIREGAEKGLSPLQSLIDKSHLKGNCKDKIPLVVKQYLNEFLDKHYATTKRLIKSSAFSLYSTRAKGAHPKEKPVCRKTFFIYLTRRDQKKIAFGRGGRRAANAAKSPTDVKKREVKGTLPFEFATLDHYYSDIFLVLAVLNGQIHACRPWISALIDVCTKNILAYWFSFRAPSARSCAMVIRQCVRNHGKLPNEVLVDRGSDFQSVFFNTLMASNRVNLVLRPSEDPPFGAEVERAFGCMKTQWLSNLSGNIVEYFEARSVSRTHSSEKAARLKIFDFVQQIRFYTEWKNNSIHADGITSPTIALSEGLRRYPFIGRKVEMNKEFILESAVDVGVYKVDPVRGIHAGEHWYWHPKLKELAMRRKPSEVRLEPEDPYKIYAKIGNSWVTCLASGEQKFLSQDPDIQLAEAIRINDGRKFRDKIKEESDQLLVKEVINTEPEAINKKEIYLPGKQPKNEDSLNKSEKSIFDELDDEDLIPLPSKKWRS
jgi:hypothetical protein